jgi:predicted porin
MSYPTIIRSRALRPTLSVLATALLFLAPVQCALAADPEIQALKELVQSLQQEMKALKETQHQQTAAIATVKNPAAKSTASVAPLAAGLTIYGVLDGGVERVTNVGVGHQGLTRVPTTTGSTPSSLGFAFERELRPGIKGIAKAEMGMTADSGASGQFRLFGRQYYVGLDSPYGSLTVGRQYSMLVYSLFGADILGPNIYGLASIDSYYPNARSDNSLAWRGKFGDVSLGASYSFGRETLGSAPASGTCAGEVAGSSQCRMMSAMVKYDTKSYGIAAAVDKQYGGTGATYSFFNGIAAGAFTASDDLDMRTTINGYAKFGELKLGVGWLNRKVSTSVTNVKQDTSWLQAEYNLNPDITLDGGVFHISNNTQDTKADLVALRGVYKFDQQFATYLSVGRLSNSSKAAYSVSAGGAGSAPAAGFAQNGLMAGVRYRF